MGRDCGMIALGTAYGQPDIILIPEGPVDPALVERVLASARPAEARGDRCVEGIVDDHGRELGANRQQGPGRQRHPLRRRRRR